MTDSHNIDSTIERLYKTIAGRVDWDPDSSYTAQLLKNGNEKIAQKLGEEAVETVVASVAEDRDAIIRESADLLYHLLVAWVNSGITPEHVAKELERREGVSG
ncbi:MAG: phosphoribosyl-ATP diphosphatase, partial [Alphaproteobacteria bacterium]|nr:phosphoribosyl-ATP diphosphatase [Alphaproteobacteria bacterium]